MSTMTDTQGRRTRRSFTDDYKTGAVRLVLDEGKTVASAARDLGLTESSLRHWVEQARADRTKGKTGLTTAEREELGRLRKESQARDAAGATVPTGTRAEPYGGGRRMSGARPMRRWVTARPGRREATPAKAAQRWRRSRAFTMLPRRAGSCGPERAICLHSADTTAIACRAEYL